MGNSIPVGLEHYKKKGPPVNGQIFENVYIQGLASICVVKWAKGDETPRNAI
jgi:hypothetical protein